MAFDKDAFLASFLNTVTGEIDTRQQEARRYKEQQEAAAERNYQLVQQRGLRASQAAQLGRRAMGLGATQQQVMAAMSSGMTGIQEFYDKLQQASSQMPGGVLGPQDIEVIMKMSDVPEIDKEMIDMGIDDFAKRTYMVGTKDSAQAPAKPEGFFAGLLNPQAAAKARLDSTEYAGGMSIADINAAVQQAEYNSLFPEASLNLRDIKYYNPEAVNDFHTTLTDAVNRAVTGSAGKAAIEQAGKKARNEGGDVAAAEQAMREILEKEAALNVVRWGAGTYYEGGFFRDTYTENTIKSIMGDEFYDELKAEYGAVDLPSPEGSSDGTPETPEGLGMTPKPEFEPVITLPPTDDKFVEAEALDEATLALVEDSMSDELIQGYSAKYTRAQWKEMSRKERRERDLPESPLGAVGFSFRDDIDELPAVKNANIMRQMDKDTYKIKIKGRGTYHVTKEQLESMTRGAFIAGEPAIEIMEYKEGEKKAKNITSNILKRYQVGS